MSLNAILKNCHLNKESNNAVTHTRIPDRVNKIPGGKFNITGGEYDAFLQQYLQEVIIAGKTDHITEKQLDSGGPITIDLDMKYPAEIKTRQHTVDTVRDILDVYLDVLKDVIVYENGKQFNIFVMEKEDVVEKPEFTKDGIHILICIALDRKYQIHVREQVLKQIGDRIDTLPFIDGLTWTDVIDDAVTSGNSNWQMYGSCKPGYTPYKVTTHYEVTGKEGEYGFEWDYRIAFAKDDDGDDDGDDNGDCEIVSSASFDMKKNFPLLTVRYTGHPAFPIKDDVVVTEPRSKKHTTNTTNNTLNNTVNTVVIGAAPGTIYDEKSLEAEITKVMQVSHLYSSYNMEEILDYTMALPEEYWSLNKSTYTKWIRVGWALKNTNPILFPFWVKMSAQAAGFTFLSVPDMMQKWNRAETSTTPLTYKSIRYWCQQDNPEEASRIKERSVDAFIDRISQTEINDTDTTEVLYMMYSNSFICASIKLQEWYEFKDHRWKRSDSATTLRNFISTTMWNKFKKKNDAIAAQIAQSGDDDDDKALTDQLKWFKEIGHRLKQTSFKANIMKEASHRFKDDEFLANLDQNVNILCFKNGVVDFSTKEFRNGRPDDYCSLCTNTNYNPIDRTNADECKILAEIDEFFAKLFPDTELREYIWEHLASTLIGTIRHQVINIYMGAGRNGKSKLVDLMSKALGGYAGTVPVSLITQARGKIGGTSSEVAQLKGVRFAVMQEPSKGDTINDGVLKQLTGGDLINARQLYQEAITYMPQFSLVMCTNYLPRIPSNDGGIWRRIRVCEFESKFTEKPYEDETEEQRKYQFPVDMHIEEKFYRWIGIFTARLVEIAFKTNGVVRECPRVLEESTRYQNDQDFLACFYRTYVRKTEDRSTGIGKQEVFEIFKIWYTQHYGPKLPQGKDVYDYIDLQCGKQIQGKWYGYRLQYYN